MDVEITVKKNRGLYLVSLSILSALLNGVIQWGAGSINIPIFMDSIFTITMGAFFGVIPGMITGLLTNGLLEVFNGFTGQYFPFFLVNMTTGFIAGLWGRRNESPDFPRFMELLIWLTLANTLLGTLVASIVFGGITGTNIDSIIRVLILTGQSMTGSSIIGRLLINLADKSIAIFILIIIRIVLIQKGGKKSLGLNE